MYVRKKIQGIYTLGAEWLLDLLDVDKLRYRTSNDSIWKIRERAPPNSLYASNIFSWINNISRLGTMDTKIR